MDLSNENVIHVKKGEVEFLQFRKLLEYSDRITHAYALGTNLNFRTEEPTGEELPKDVFEKNLSDYKKFCKAIDSNYINIVRPIQRHTDKVESVTQKCNKDFPDIFEKKYFEVDGLITNKPNLLLTTTNADCILLMFFDPENNIVANIHSGWKGTYQKIAVKTVYKMMEKYGSKPENVICCICPSIRKCHFVVKSDVKEMFMEKFAYLKNIDEIIEEKIPNKEWTIDTVLINKIILKEVGMKEENIIDSQICNVCNADIMHSYRVEKSGYGLSAAFIEIKDQ